MEIMTGQFTREIILEHDMESITTFPLLQNNIIESITHKIVVVSTFILLTGNSYNTAKISYSSISEAHFLNKEVPFER